MTRIRQIQARPERLELTANAPVLLNGSNGRWQIVRGFVDIFATRLDPDGQPGRRIFITRLQEGDWLYGLPAEPAWVLIAVGGRDSMLGNAGMPAAASDAAATEAAATEAWMLRLARGLAAAEQSLNVAAAPAAPSEPPTALPPAELPARIQALFAAQQEAAARTAQHRRELAEAQQARGIASLVSVLETDKSAAETVLLDPLTVCLRAIAGAIGVSVDLPAVDASLPMAERAQQLLHGAELRSRPVLLRGDWWRDDHGPLLGFDENDGRPLALLPQGGGYRCLDPAGETAQTVDRELAGRITGEALMVYAGLDEKPQRLLDLVRFAGRGADRDLLRIAGYGLLSALMAVVTPVATGILIDLILPAGNRTQLAMLVLLIAGTGLGGLAFKLVSAFARLRLEARADVRVQTALFDRVLRLPLTVLKRYPVGDLADRLLGMQRVREQLAGATMSAVLAMIFSTASLVVLFFYTWQLALVATAMALVYSLVVLSLVLCQLRHERAQADARGLVQGFNTQLIVGIGKLRIAHGEGRAFGTWARLFADQKRHFIASGRVANRLGVFQSAFTPVANALVMGGMIVLADQLHLLPASLPANRLSPGADGGGISPGMFVAFSAAFGQFLAGASAGVTALSAGLSAVPQFERARPLLQHMPDSRRSRRDPGRLTGALEFSNLSFRYAEDGPLVLERVSFQIAAGEYVAIVGPSGSGKSTTQRLLIGLETPSAGEVRYDGQALPLLDYASVRRQLGVVLQHTVLPGGPIHRIILGDRPGDLADAWDAARQAGLEDDIRAMPMGMHTVLPEGATTLSGGQSQRLAIARALARNPRILLLDEATSALDNTAQTLVANTLASLDITRVMVAHRLSTIRQAHRILVLDKGRLVEEGPFGELLQAGGVFARLANRQLL